MTLLISLSVCASFSLNLILHFALGIQGIAEGQERSDPLPLVQGGILFISVLLLWWVCSYLLFPLAFGFLEYVLLVPLCAFTCTGLETLCTRLFPSPKTQTKLFAPDSAYSGLAIFSLLLTLHLAGTLLEAMILSLSFALGSIMVLFLLRYIRKRSALERVPLLLRGRPLLLIAMGLLSLLFASVTTIFFNILGIF